MKCRVSAAGLAVAFVLSTVAAYAQTGIARGRVQEEGTGQPLVAAKVSWEFQGGLSRKGQVTTNKKGDFVQVGLAPGPYRFTASMDGYRSQFIEIKVGLGDNEVPTFDMKKAGAAAAAGAGAGAGAAGSADATLAALRGAVEQAIQLANAGKLDEALAIYTDLEAKNPTIYQIPYNMAGLYVRKKDVANAEAAYQKALELKPDYTEAYIRLSNLYTINGQGDKAAEALTKAVAEHPDDAGLALQQGIVLFNTGKQAEAAAAFKKIAAGDPTNPEPYFYLGSIAVGEGKTAECIASLEKYLSMNPQNAQNVATAKGLIAALKK
jgi:cytochrome c-type biogenesis protein CcmH/NrfG